MDQARSLMARRFTATNKYSFAKQFLKDKHIEIYRGKEQILKPLGVQKYPIKLPNTRYFVGELFAEEITNTKITSYAEILDLGYCIRSRHVMQKERWAQRQVVVYELKKKGDVIDEQQLKSMPGTSPHYVELNRNNNLIRLVGLRAGPLGYGPWIRIDGRKTINKKKIDYYRQKTDDRIKIQMNEWLGVEEKPEPIYIPEAAFMITDSNEIVCFPCDSPDMPSILITGLKRTGKSYSLHSILDRFFWKKTFNYRIAILNDSSAECGTWCIPNNDAEQIKSLRRLNEKPLPLPTVYFHPRFKESYQKLHMGEVGFDISIPFKEIIDNHKEYLNIEGSARYFTKFQEQLKNCDNQQQAQALLDTISISHQVPQNTANKIRAEFDTLFDTQMTDISGDRQEAWSINTYPDKRMNPLTTCLQAGLIPILETGYMSSRPELLAIYFRYLASDLFNRQSNDKDFIDANSQILLVLDEAHNISGKANRNTSADYLLRRCVKEGGPRRFGTLLATQEFSELHESIVKNTTHLICFKNPNEAAKIANTYHMGVNAVNIIKDLGKHECVAYTTEHFIVYDSNGNRRKSNLNELFKGKSLPCLSQHKRPLKKK